MIEIKELNFRYSKEETYALKNINLTIQDGECVLLCGRSGCGKSTLLKLINGIIPEFYNGEISGSVKVNDMNTFDTETYKISKKVGSVFQNPKTQFYTTNTTDELAFGLENYGIARETINRKIEEVKKDLSLESLVDRNIFELSGGEKQKIAIASAYALNPEVFVLDEPSSSLDINSMKELSATIARLKTMGKTIIIAEHRLWYLKTIVDRAICLEDGEVIKEYSMDEIQKLSEKERMSTGLRHTESSDFNSIENKSISMNTYSISICDLVFKRRNRTVLKIDKLCFEYGNIIGIVGKNGIGKSTFAKIFCGLEKQNSGRILKNDKELSLSSRLKNSLLIMQEVNQQLFTDTVYEEIGLTSNVSDKNKLNSWMEDMQIEDLGHRNPHTLSGGQKQKVIILSALHSDKNVLFFDEPTSGLDYASMKIVAENIKKVKNANKLILIISHDFEFLKIVCDKIVHL